MSGAQANTNGKTAGQLEFSGETSFRIVSDSEKGLSGNLEMRWSNLSPLLDLYLKSNRGKNVNPEHYRAVITHEVERIIMNKVRETGKDALQIKVELNKEFGMHSKTLHADINIEWMPNLPELNINEIKLKQYSVESFSEEDIQEVKNQFLDSNRALEPHTGKIEKGDRLKIGWSWKIGDTDDWTPEIESVDGKSAKLIEIGHDQMEFDLQARILESSVGDSVEHSMVVPKDLNEGSVSPEYSKHIKDIVRFAGKTVYVKARIIEAFRPVRPVIDEVLLKRYDLASEEALNKKILENLHEYVKEQNLNIAFAQILDYLRKQNVAVPEAYTKEYTRYMLYKFAQVFRVPPKDNKYDFDSQDFQEDVFNKIKTEFPAWPYSNFDEFSAKLTEVASEVMTGELMLTQVKKIVNIGDKEYEEYINKRWIEAGDSYRKRLQESEAERREFVRNAQSKLMLTKLVEMLKEAGNSDESETKNMEEFKTSIMALSDDALHTKYFAKHST